MGLAERLPETPAIVLMERVTVAPGTAIPADPGDPAFSFFRIESGVLTIGADSPLAVVRAAALAEAQATPGAMPAPDGAAAGSAVSLAAGDSVVIPPGVGGSISNAGAEPAVVPITHEEEMIRAIRAVANGEAIFGPAIASRVLAFFAAGRTEPPSLFPTLTGREREILRLLAQGKRNAAIADELFLSPKTVANHVSNIISKLHVADRAEALVRAREAGLA